MFFLFTISSLLNLLFICNNGEGNLCIQQPFESLLNRRERVFTLTLCEEDSITINGIKFHKNHTLDSTVMIGGAHDGFDSIVLYNINILPVDTGYIDTMICDGSFIMILGERFEFTHPSGWVRLANSSHLGCDSIIRVTVGFIPLTKSFLDTTICEGSSYTLGSETFSQSRPAGTVKLSGSSKHGCDSFVQVRTFYTKQKRSTYTETICSESTKQIHGIRFDKNHLVDSVRLASVQGCDSIVQIRLSLNTPIQFDFTLENPFCEIKDDGIFKLQSVNGGVGPYTIQIDNNPKSILLPSFEYKNLSFGKHAVTVTDQLGCSATEVFDYNQHNTSFLSLISEIKILRGQTISLEPQINFTPSFIAWTPPAGLSCTNCLSPQASPWQTIDYNLTLKDEGGCEKKAIVRIVVEEEKNKLHIPNVFSPNNDNINDFFHPVGNERLEKIHRIMIYDRWGELVYDEDDINHRAIKFGWDGTFKNELAQNGVYVYYIEYNFINEPKHKTSGDITLLR